MSSSSPAAAPSWLHAEAGALRNEDGHPIVLRGVGIGGWMNLENFITGHPSTESLLRTELARVLGPETLETFFARFLDGFFAEADAQFIASIGLNFVRLPVNYRHFEDDDRPGEFKASGFAQLDRAVRLCRRSGLWALIDLHALPGGQNHDWHSDNPSHVPLLWRHRDFQDRTVGLWERLAERYRDEPTVAGYNLVNEPADPTGHGLGPLYRRLAAAIRAIDSRHVLFLDGDRYAQDFTTIGEPLDNAVYALHHYPHPGSLSGGDYPGLSGGVHYDRGRVAQEIDERTGYMAHHDLASLVGEFGPVYVGDERADAMRLRLLRDQIELYEQRQMSWCLWTYKDIGLQGLCYLAPDAFWRAHLGGIIAKKARLGVDGWGGRASQLADVLEPLERRFAAEFPAFSPYPFGARNYVHRLVRHILFAEPLVVEFAERFGGLSGQELDALADSFRLEHCVQRTPLVELLRSLTSTAP
ncbi:MAG: cellulase family glycosylhydrolase [Actinomycetota bacterium]|nr:cellulase family glycosylhydrolase [Actinomycetota bacterium]